MIRPPPKSTRTDTLVPSTTLFRSPGLEPASGACSASSAARREEHPPHRVARRIEREMPCDVVQAVAAERRPQRLVLVQAHDRIGDCRRIVGDQHVVAVAQVHAFHRARGGPHRLAGGHAQVYLALDAGAVAPRAPPPQHPAPLWADGGYVAMDTD